MLLSFWANAQRLAAAAPAAAVSRTRELWMPGALVLATERVDVQEHLVPDGQGGKLRQIGGGKPPHERAVPLRAAALQPPPLQLEPVVTVLNTIQEEAEVDQEAPPRTAKQKGQRAG